MTPEAYENDLVAQIASLDAALGSVHETLKAEGVKRDKRIRSNRWATALAILAALIGIGVGILGVNAGRSSQRALDEANAQRNENKIAACLQYKKQQEQGIDSDIAQSHDLIDALAASSPQTPATDTAVVAYNEKHDALIREGHPLRDCSPAGIEKYLSDQEGP